MYLLLSRAHRPFSLRFCCALHLTRPHPPPPHCHRPYSQANSEVSALLGRIPSAVGYQPTLATDLGQLQERITTTKKGSITSVQVGAGRGAGSVGQVGWGGEELLVGVGASTRVWWQRPTPHAAGQMRRCTTRAVGRGLSAGV